MTDPNLISEERIRAALAALAALGLREIHSGDPARDGYDV